MKHSIGLLELNSIAKGIEAADFMFKAASVNLMFSRAVCPGKFIILIDGDVGSVKTSIQTGIETGKNFVVDSLVIPNVHPQLIAAINSSTAIEKVDALGVIEYFSIASAVIGADAAAKTGQIDLIEVRLGMGIGGKSFITLCGSVSSVEEAVKAGVRDAAEKGMLIHSCVIPSPSVEVFERLL